MGFLKKLGRLFSAGSTRSAPLLNVAVRCNRCKEIIHGQINLHNDLSLEYVGDATHYFCRKGLVGTGENHCFQQISIEYTFDTNRHVIDRKIEGGQFEDEGE